ncbi:cell wall hydrolase [Alkaliphilus peptidifermentans]|uniref:N-acetylmuramoyl-L-alanine amidase n=1 Tax=Alkaliphilus peptidifermentans DSM 18978 TaxID=1120976 RepID=A0A1G5CGW1_9FIRM|nr:cell wall hydrolase [Alkaliphilus peptidifermentans]SCY01755.1 N-acetylmuramoyl-L-alanine amidase [Alkaliphilus peptidifermentans DSM 18978]
MIKQILKTNKYVLYSIGAILVISLMASFVLFFQTEEANSDNLIGIEEKQYDETNEEANGLELADSAEDKDDELAEAEEEKTDTYPPDKLQKNEKNKTEVSVEVETEIIEAEKPETEEEKANLSPITSDQYIVQNNDTLYVISQRAGLSIEDIKSYNRMNSDSIMVGQVLLLKKPEAPVGETSPPISRGTVRDDDLYWLSRIIHAEAQGEPYKGKVAVGNVVLNRVKSDEFPNSIYGVVFDKQHGYTQFSPVIDGTIYNTPNSESIEAAKEALNGAKPVGDVLYFLNPRKSTNFWIVENRKFFTTIADHDFYY